MRIDNIDFLKFFPDLMQNDKDVIAIAETQNKFYKTVAKKINVLSRWGKFSAMTETELDFLAEDLYIPWYKKDDSKDIKVSTLEHFVDVWSTLGTTQAIQTAIGDIYGNAELIEWFDQKDDYKNGEFAIEVANFALLSQERKNRLYKTLEIIKRKSQLLHSVYTIDYSDVPAYYGVLGGVNRVVAAKDVATAYMPEVNVTVNSYSNVCCLVNKTDVSIVTAKYKLKIAPEVSIKNYVGVSVLTSKVDTSIDNAEL